VEGASEGYGLGFEFLKHIRRCRVLLHLIDSSSPDPVTDYELIEGELRAYDPKLDEVKRVVAVSKADLDPEAAAESANKLVAHLGQPVRITSADEGTGTEALMSELMALVAEEKAHRPPIERSPSCVRNRVSDSPCARSRKGGSWSRVTGP
jgi:GTP-binding protein